MKTLYIGFIYLPMIELGRIEKFLNMFSSKNTIIAYRWSLKEFFKTIYNIEIEDFSKLEKIADKYFKEKRKYEEDIEKFFIAIKDRPPKTIRLAISSIRTFLIENGVELKEAFWRRLRKRIKGSRALTLDKVPNNNELKQIILHMPIHGKALTLLLLSSGMRIGEALKLKVEDIDLEKEPARINIKGEYTKTGNPRIAFCSKEAKELLKEWLKIREQYLKQAFERSRVYQKDKEDPRLFPFELPVFYEIWEKAVKRAGYEKIEERTNRQLLHVHCLRKFFRTRMATLIPVDIVEALMGHSQYLDSVYRRYSVEDLEQFYTQGEPSVLVFSSGEDIAKLKKEIEDKNLQLQNIINGLVSENLALKTKITENEKAIKELEKKLEEVIRKLQI
jgi:integrase